MWKMFILKTNNKYIGHLNKAAVGIVMIIQSDVLIHFLTQKKVTCSMLICFQQFGQNCMEEVPWHWLNFKKY
jgi:Na+/melibiose symporter-like transporter